MKRTLVYDIPTRIFHWLFVALFLFSFLIAKNVDDESVLFSYHMISGILLTGIVLLRVLWGLWGTQFARFSSFELSPAKLIAYMKGLFVPGSKRFAGHNPASSWAAVVMMLLAVDLGITGYLMATGQKETFEDAHEILGNMLLITALAHVVGVILHQVRHRDAIGLSMISGRKSLDAGSPDVGLRTAAPLAGLAFVVAIAYFGFHLVQNFDPASRTLNLFGTTLQLGEADEGPGEVESSEKNSDNVSEGDEDDDD